MATSGRLTILPYAMMMVQDLAARNSVIKQMEERVASYVFDSSDTPWFVRFDTEKGSADEPATRATTRGAGAGGLTQQKNAFYPDIFNGPEYRLALRRFMETARNIVRRFGFCAYYVLKPGAVARWWKEYMTAGPARRTLLGLPMGIIEPDQAIFTIEPPEKDTWMGPLRRVLRVTALGAGDKDYIYHVFDQDATFVATPESMWNASAARQHHPARTHLMQHGIGDGLAYSAIPSSEFYDLVDMMQHLQETRQNHLFAESQVAQTLIIVQAKPPNLRDTGPQNIPTSRLFEPTTVLEERLNQVAEVRTWTLTQAKEHLDQLQARLGGRGGDMEDAPKIVKDRRAALGRPSPVEEMIELSEDMQLAHVSRPTAILRLDEVELNFRRAVASALKLPFSMTEGSAASNGGLKDEAHSFNGARSVESLEEKQLAATVLRERAFYSTFFEHVYAVTFGDIDMRELQNAQDMYESMLAEMKQGKRLGEQLGRELAGMHDAAQEAKDEKQRAAEAAAQVASSKEDRQRVRVSLRRVRDLVERMHCRGSGFAQLVFQPGMTRDAINQLTGLLAIFDRGVLSAKTLEPFVQDVFGPGAVLREPPAPDVVGATALGRKRKKAPDSTALSIRAPKRQKLESEKSTAKRKRSATDESDKARRKQQDQKRRAQSVRRTSGAAKEENATAEGNDSDSG
jgi:hypothetical protein